MSRSARFFERRVADHYPRIGSGVFESSTRCTFDARVASSGCVVAMFTGSRFYERENFGAASPCSRIHRACAESGGQTPDENRRQEQIAPITHRISKLPTPSTARRRNYAIALHAEPVRPRTFVLLFGVDLEIAFWRRFRRQPNRTRHSIRQRSPSIHNVFLESETSTRHGGGFVGRYAVT